ncbi:MAG: tRNA (adenosine(37)-N6)-dimethylallyltransferase MiaA [Bacteroidales bacterium]|nr:tRNA (adenosine(37)-N6)-dimethylallyltransferase MiaA [Bacteroidales bacterium]MDY6002353.1 tRNA (adenosine(37)-N6)-dimethylallyltransferase MiaA [Candidatus Cryptobacteroides sp.]
MERRLLIVLGPTAVGKSEYAVSEAIKYGSPVFSCDSRQIFKSMTIGTAVPDASLLAAVKHYFIQTVPVTETFSAGDYELQAIPLIEKLFSEGHETLVMAGGSMLYVDAVCKGLDDLPDGNQQLRDELWQQLKEEGLGVLAEQLRRLDPATYSKIDIQNSHRVIRALEVCIQAGQPFSSFKTGIVRERNFKIEKIGLRRPKEELYSRINQRVLNMLSAGLEDEVRSLMPYRKCQALQTVGYKEMFEYLNEKIPLEEAVRLIQRNTRHYAKRQMTWWRKDQSIRWIDL